MSAVQAAIREALGTEPGQRRSVLQLAQAMDIHHSTLQRWMKGTNAAYDLDALVKLYALAGRSMDADFGLPVAPNSEAILSAISQMRIELGDKMDAVVKASEASKLLSSHEPDLLDTARTRQLQEKALDELESKSATGRKRGS